MLSQGSPLALIGAGLLWLLCLIWLRSTNQGVWWTLMLFAATWAADIGAFAVGSALKGPKLWPRQQFSNIHAGSSRKPEPELILRPLDY